MSSTTPQQYPTNPYSAQATLGPPNKPAGTSTSGGGGWKWLWIFLGLGGVGFVVCCGACAAVGYFGMNAMKYTPPYKEALAKARESVEVKEKLGSPLEDTLIYEGTTSKFNNGEQEIHFSFKVKGPNGEGTVVVDSSGKGESWKLQKCTITFADGTTHELVDPIAENDADPSEPNNGSTEEMEKKEPEEPASNP